MATALVIAISQVPTASGAASDSLPLTTAPDLHSSAAGVATPSANSRAQVLSSRVSALESSAPGLLQDPAATESSRGPGAERCPSVQRAIKFYSRRVAYWRDRMGASAALAGGGPGPTGHRPAGAGCPRYLAHVLQRKAYGLRRAYAKVAAERRAHYRRLYEKWRCIHEHEGAWNSNTGNGYWGGLQMDWGFMHTYGPEFIRRWGLAHRWPVWAQLVAAERAYHGFAGYGGRGYSPWGTRGMCGL